MHRFTVIILLITSAAFAQTFEAATVKPYPAGEPIQWSGCQGGPGSNDPGLIRCQYATLRLLLARAYKLKEEEVFGPAVLETERFNVTAKLPEGARRDQVPEMYRNLLIEKFKVTVHHETKPLPGYALTVAKGGIKIKPPGPPQEDPPPTADGRLPIGEDGFPILRPSSIAAGSVILYRNGRARLQAGSIKMSALAESLTGQLGQVVIDETGLDGPYAITLNWVPDALEPGGRRPDTAPQEASTPEVRLIDALEQQLGLKLVSKKILRDTIVVDHIEKSPAE